jgi:hypothetical protein
MLAVQCWSNQYRLSFSTVQISTVQISTVQINPVPNSSKRFGYLGASPLIKAQKPLDNVRQHATEEILAKNCLSDTGLYAQSLTSALHIELYVRNFTYRTLRTGLYVQGCIHRAVYTGLYRRGFYRQG